MSYDFDYTGSIQTFVAPSSGIYKLELWGAQGGGVDKVDNNGSYGGYACGNIELEEGETLYIGVGGQGGNPGNGSNYGSGGYNGGGNGGRGYSNYHAGGGGGGATHIATNNNRGELKNYSANRDEILIVAGGGAGCSDWWDLAVQVGFFVRFYVGSGGGIEGSHGDCYGGTAPNGGTQSTGYAFGQGQNGRNGTSIGGDGEGDSGAGGGYYGGYANGGSQNGLGAGGSGYIGNTRLYNKKMVGFEVQTSSDPETKTFNSNSHASNPTSEIPKEGNGYVRISEITYKTSGQAIYTLSNYIKGGNDTLLFDSAIPTGTSLSVYTKVDSGNYVQIQNGDLIPNLPESSNCTLYIKVAMSTSIATKTPALSNLRIEDDYNVRKVIELGLNVPNITPAVGNAKVSYDGLGNPAGAGGPTEAFEGTFTPSGMTWKGHQNDVEHITLSSISATASVTRVTYYDTQENEHLETTFTASAVLTNIHDL